MSSMQVDSQEFDEYDNEYEGDDAQPPPLPPPTYRNNNRNARYNNAYGHYRGGYGPGGGFGPRPMFPGGPMPWDWNGSYGPNMPPPFRMKQGINNHGAVKYLMRCGLTRDVLRNLPIDLLNLIEPDYCGLCGMSFDSFAMSKMHYISKNHAKNQKKWLGHKMQDTMKYKEVMPLKARELYCELCDVQMTSKSHASAHYSGKPHSAIVQGRKNPKNPMLLQSGMKTRLNQLIAREKKHLKLNVQSKQEADSKKDEKITCPELYCEICKTAVTCSEQMTMHLNGKKHLTKEKQYILKQMKGPGNSSDGGKKEDNADEDWGEPWDHEGEGETEADEAAQDQDSEAAQEADAEAEEELDGEAYAEL